MAQQKKRWRWISRWSIVRLALVVALPSGAAYQCMIRMPGESYRGELLPLAEHEQALRDELERDVRLLADEIGERNLYRPAALRKAADAIAGALGAAGYAVEREVYRVGGAVCENVWAERAGTDAGSAAIVVGAHYDTVAGCPGANDNGTGVAAVLALARRFASRSVRSTIRFVAFVNEEPPYFQTEDMGSRVHARRSRERGDRIAGMLSLETMGYYSDEEGSQAYPFPLGVFYPKRGDFIGFVGNLSSRRWVRRVIGLFREHARFPSEGAALPEKLPGVGWSDHWSFAQEGYPALMITDTAPFRYPHYHEPTDTPEKIDFDRFARVVAGLERVLVAIVEGS